MLLMRTRANPTSSLALFDYKGPGVYVPGANTCTFTPGFTKLTEVRGRKVSKIRKYKKRWGFPDHTGSRVLKTTWDLITSTQPYNGTTEFEGSIA